MTEWEVRWIQFTVWCVAALVAWWLGHGYGHSRGYADGWDAGRTHEAEAVNQALAEHQAEYRRQLTLESRYTELPFDEGPHDRA